MPVNPFIAALGDVFQGLSVDRANKRKLSLEEEERRRRDEQQLLGNRMALYEAGYRPTGDMEGVLEGLQGLQAQQGVIGRALTPQAIAEAASQAAPRKLQTSPGYEDLSAKETDPLNLSEMVSNVQRSMQTPLRLLGARPGEYTNYSLDPTQTRSALEMARDSRQANTAAAAAERSNEAVYRRQLDVATAAARVTAEKNRSDDEGTWNAYKMGLPSGSSDQLLSVDNARKKYGDVSKFVEQKGKDAAVAASGAASEERILQHKDNAGRMLQDKYEKSNQEFAAYGQEIPNLIKELTMVPQKGWDQGASDNAIISFMAHLIDPKTGVRQSDVDNALKAQGFYNTWSNFNKRLLAGETLSPNFRRQILRLVLNVAETVKARSKANDDYYQQRAKNERIDSGYLTMVNMLPGIDLEAVGLQAGFPEYVQRQKDREFVNLYGKRAP